MIDRYYEMFVKLKKNAIKFAIALLETLMQQC